MRAVAWVSVIKDGLMLLAAVCIGIAIPYAHFGGIGPMFAALAQAHPRHLTDAWGHRELRGTLVCLHRFDDSLGFYMWPHAFGSLFTAKSADTLRRNAVVMPLYTLTLAFIFFAGFASVLIVPGLKDGDLACSPSSQHFPAWLLGLIGGAGALTAMVPASIFILTAATLFAKNLIRPVLAPAMSDDQVAKLARAMVIVLGLVSLYLAIVSSRRWLRLLLMGYAGVSQFFPGVVLGIYWRRVTMTGVFCGMVAGVGTDVFLMLSAPRPVLRDQLRVSSRCA